VALQKQILNETGEMHAAQDGVTLGILITLSLTYPLAVAVIGSVLAIDGVKPRKILQSADNFIRKDDITNSPEYFIGGLIIGGVVGYIVGTLAVMAGLPSSLGAV